MKRLFFLSLVIIIAGKAQAQTDTTKVEQYCQMTSTAKPFSKKVTIDIDFGEARRFWSDNRVRDETGKVKSLNTVVDAMNYLGSQGWRLTTVLMISNSPYDYIYVFRREVLKSELKGEDSANGK